ncbi:unnamed protein product [Brachionus calyciflorus]|uniref:Uncharacterized protein n=1 Tax=Brachionus calyciflorus TaxID=104777 RepID=A0A813Y6P9_9BILA|nr:unnamed protein product [Brachionus calyciflorus]
MTLDFRKVIGLFYDTTTTTTSTKTLFSTISSLSTTATTTASLSETSSSPDAPTSVTSAISASSTKAPISIALITATNTAYSRLNSLSADAPTSVTSTKVPTQLALTTSRTKTSSTHVPNSESSTKADTSIALITTTTASSIATSSLPDAPTLTTVQTMSLYTKALNSLSSTAASTSPSPTLMTSMTPSTRSTKKKFKLAPFTATSKIAKTLQTEIKNKTTTILKNKGFFYENNNLNTKSDGPVSNFIVTTSAPFLSSSPSYPSKPFTSFDSADNFVSSYFLTLINLNSNVNKEESSQPFKIDKMSISEISQDSISKQRKDNENDLEELVLNLNLLTLSDSNHNSEDKNSIYKTPKVSFLNEKKNDTIKLSSDSDKTERSITMSSSSVSFCLNIFDSFEKTAVIQEPIHVNNATITLSSDESVSEESHISVIDSHSDSGSSESIEN